MFAFLKKERVKSARILVFLPVTEWTNRFQEWSLLVPKVFLLIESWPGSKKTKVALLHHLRMRWIYICSVTNAWMTVAGCWFAA